MLTQIGIIPDENGSIGDPGKYGRPFYVNENLTTNNHKILQQAIKCKKENKIKAAFTLRGLVYIKYDENDKPIRVDSLDDIAHLFRDDL